MHAFDRQTDGQTDGRTDGRTDRNLIVRPRCIPCSVVKIAQYSLYHLISVINFLFQYTDFILLMAVTYLKYKAILILSIVQSNPCGATIHIKNRHIPNIFSTAYRMAQIKWYHSAYLTFYNKAARRMLAGLSVLLVGCSLAFLYFLKTQTLICQIGQRAPPKSIPKVW